MQVKVELVGPDSNIPPADRKNISVDVHTKRGDTFHVMRNHNLLEGDAAQVFSIPAGGRLVITTPEAQEEMVYDRDQGASVRRSSQANAGLRADRASDNIRPVDTPPTTPPEYRRAPTLPPQGMAPLPNAPPTTPPPQGTSRIQTAQQSQPRVQTQQQPYQAPGGTPGDPAAKAAEAAKASQQGGTPRPAGEKPPLPGSPVGSPPDGNEGKDK